MRMRSPFSEENGRRSFGSSRFSTRRGRCRTATAHVHRRPACRIRKIISFFFLFSVAVVAVVAVIVVVVIPHLLFFSSLDKHSARPGRSFFSLSLSCSSFFSDVEVNQSSEFSKKIRALCS